MGEWPTVRNSRWLDDVLGEARIAAYWRHALERVYGPDKMHTWSYQWHFACWLHDGLTILPAENLISNIGFGAAGTHTTGSSPFANMKISPTAFPLRHPPLIIRDAKADARSDKTLFLPRPLLVRAAGKLRRVLRTPDKAAH